jgi:hypothetical protein
MLSKMRFDWNAAAKLLIMHDVFERPVCQELGASLNLKRQKTHSRR